jgi:hypothetical protein
LATWSANFKASMGKISLKSLCWVMGQGQTQACIVLLIESIVQCNGKHVAYLCPNVHILYPPSRRLIFIDLSKLSNLGRLVFSFPNFLIEHWLQCNCKLLQNGGMSGADFSFLSANPSFQPLYLHNMYSLLLVMTWQCVMVLAKSQRNNPQAVWSPNNLMNESSQLCQT